MTTGFIRSGCYHFSFSGNQLLSSDSHKLNLLYKAPSSSAHTGAAEPVEILVPVSCIHHELDHPFFPFDDPSMYMTITNRYASVLLNFIVSSDWFRRVHNLCIPAFQSVPAKLFIFWTLLCFSSLICRHWFSLPSSPEWYLQISISDRLIFITPHNTGLMSYNASLMP